MSVPQPSFMQLCIVRVVFRVSVAGRLQPDPHPFHPARPMLAPVILYQSVRNNLGFSALRGSVKPVIHLWELLCRNVDCNEGLPLKGRPPQRPNLYGGEESSLMGSRASPAVTLGLKRWATSAWGVADL